MVVIYSVSLAQIVFVHILHENDPADAEYTHFEYQIRRPNAHIYYYIKVT